jgi:hypothetical protein
VSLPQTTSTQETASWFVRQRWNRGDLVALLVWTAAIAWFFWDVVSLRRALFYFDITEINFPYRAFFAEELRAGRFSRWCPGLYCGMPLFSESQAGYLHPLKYLLYPWLQTWQAFNLDTVLSIWLTGLGTYGWLRRHVGPAGALTGASIFGLSGFMWGHLIHTSMNNALTSVPFAVWALEWSWESGRWRGAVLGAVALACQVFAGHLQDVFLTAGILALYGLYRAATERNPRARFNALSMTGVLIGLGILLSAVQWIPSKELLDRSPRAGGLSWEELTYGSWHPELLPTLIVREAYGTRARDTDWMDGFYPYHEMDTYLGLITLTLAVIGAGGAGQRDRWTSFWVILAGAGGLLMLGKFTFLFDYANRIPVLGSSREPVRLHLWVFLALAALAAVGVERLGRPGQVRLRGGLILAAVLIVASIPILIHVYAPVWTEPRRWTQPYHLDRYRWLGQELIAAALRSALLAVVAWVVAFCAARTLDSRRRARLAALLPLLVLADLLGAHKADVPTVPQEYWTKPPETARRLLADPTFIRVFGSGDYSAGEPGYASERIDFLRVRDPLDWSLPLVWHLAASKGETPMIAQRLLDYFNHVKYGQGRFDLESVTHLVTGRGLKASFTSMPSERVGTAYIHRNPKALPRARLVGRPVYARGQREAITALEELGTEYRDRLVVEDPTTPLSPDAQASGTARIIKELPERVVVHTEAAMPAYLVLADTFDPGWSATLDAHPVPIRPAYVAFRAVFLPPGPHTVIFTYSPAGFGLGLSLTGCGVFLALVLLIWPEVGRSWAHLQVDRLPDHVTLNWPAGWRTYWFLSLMAIILASTITLGPGRRPTIQSRWDGSFHRFTWGAGIEAMKANRR